MKNTQNSIKEEFISTLSHEIRTPLTSIKGFCQTMLNSWEILDENKKKEFLKIIEGQAQRLINLCENVLNVAKLDSDSSDLILCKIDLNACIKETLKIVNVNHRDIVFNLKEAKGELYSLCDKDKTQQILINILDNAIKYGDSSQIDIKTYRDNDFNVFSIKNYGSYIEEKNRGKIFEKFFRIDSYIRSSTQGSGLGLYIVNNLINRMQGKIEVQSSETKKETEFIVYLPVYEVEKLTKTARGINV